MPNPPSPPSPVSSGKKRPHPSNTPPMQTDPATNTAPNPSTAAAVPSTSPAHSTTPASSASSSFRNVSACNRCRLRKNRCDQRLPRCQSCEKAGVRCVGYDPITKREIPRSYVYFLESRVAHLEKQLADNNIEFKKVVAFDEEEAIKVEADGDAAQARSGSDGQAGEGSTAEKARWKNKSKEDADRPDRREEGDNRDAENDLASEDNWRLHNLVSNIGMVSVQGTSDPRYLGSTSGISFARVVFAAVRSSLPGNMPERAAIRTSDRLPQSATGTAGGGGSMRDSFFGLQTRPMMKCATFPDRELAERLVDLYFEHANPQMPILHRGDFMELLDKTYLLEEEKKRSPRALYVLNIVFAIGAGIIFEDKPQSSDDENRSNHDRSSSGTKRPRLSSHQYQPEEYHASAIVHLESFLGSSSSEGFGGLEELQAVLLLASFALLRPVAPGLWYIVGVATRLAVDLGLHYEDGAGIDSATKDGNQVQSRIDARERGRREWVRDLRRRLWWCVYSFDRLVATCVGRPFGISDQAISTEFPSMMDDQYITKSGLLTPPDGAPTYKRVAVHYFKLRLLQSEIHDVLQYQQTRAVRRGGPGAVILPHAELSSPFLQGFDSFRSWRYDVHRRLVEWQETAPTRPETGVRFSIELLELNYWQGIILLYQQSLTVPAELAGELTPADDVSSPSFSNPDDGDEEDHVYLNVAEAGQKVIRIYRQLHRVRLVNYTYLATHHIFMAGISFLYAIWHSPLVRSRLTLDEVDFTVLAATSVLGDLMHKCPPAEACRDAFERMSKATVQMCFSTTGFGSQVDMSRVHATSNTGSSLHPGRPRQPMDQRHRAGQGQPRRATQTRQSRPVPKFDMNLADLFTDNTPLADHPRAENRPGGPPYPQPESIPPNFSADQSSRSYGRRNPSMDYYLKYENPNSPQPHPQFYYSNSPPKSGSPGSNTHNHNHGLPPADTEAAQGMSLDFLDFGSGDADGQGNTEGEANPDYNMMAAPSLGPNLGQNVGIDLGFGMAMDFQHDWSENPNYDLLEGYFFGGSGAGAPGGDV